MPLYEYECDACGKRLEVIRKFSDPPLEVCKECGKGPIHKLLSSPAIQFKGSGFYITDYAKKGKSDTSSSAPAGKTGESTKSEGTKSESSGETSSTSKSETKSDSGSSGSKKE